MFRGAVLFLIAFVKFSEIYSAPAEVDNSKNEILSNEYNLNPEGSYNYNDGQYAHVEGKLNDDGSPRVQGIYYFDGTDGKPDITCFIADEKDYRTGSEAVVVIITTTQKRFRPINRGLPAELHPKTFAGFFG